MHEEDGDDTCSTRLCCCRFAISRQDLVNVGVDGLRPRVRPEAVHWLSLRIHEELGEVPLDALRPQEAWLFTLQEREQGVGSVTVHLNLRATNKDDSTVTIQSFHTISMVVSYQYTVRRADTPSKTSGT